MSVRERATVLRLEINCARREVPNVCEGTDPGLACMISSDTFFALGRLPTQRAFASNSLSALRA